jgi:hypothetical protein
MVSLDFSGEIVYGDMSTAEMDRNHEDAASEPSFQHHQTSLCGFVLSRLVVKAVEAVGSS